MDISQYINFSQEIDSAIIQDVESRIRTLLKRKWIDLDTNPSSVFGNLFLTPAARVIALMEQTTNCVLSDLNLENALNGIVCDCDFLQNYLKGLGVNSLAEVNTTAMVRITFNTNARYKIDQGELLLFNDDYVFSFVHGNNPTIVIEPYYYPKINSSQISYIGGKGIERPDYVNNIYHLSASNVTFNNVSVVASEFFVDLPVYGPASAQISAGTTATIDEHFGYETVDTWVVNDNDDVVGPTEVPNVNLANDYITSITMLQDVSPITTPTNIAELIELTQKIKPTSALTTRAGSTSFITNNFPSIVGTSTVLYGDYEMVRANDATAQNVFPAVDIYNKGVSTLLECVEYCPATNKGLQTFPLQHMPIKITGISYLSNISSSTEETQLDLPAFPSHVLSFGGTYKNSTVFSGHKAYTINASTDTYNIQGNTFVKLSYLYDPTQEAIGKTILSDSCGPILNILSRPFFPIHIRSITIDYKKQAGKFFDRQVAIDEIYNFINNLVYPVVYDDAYIGDIIIGNGATSIDSISVNCYVQGAEATGKHAAYVQNINTLSINQAALGSKELRNLQLGDRNIQYILPRDAIHLIEHTM